MKRGFSLAEMMIVLTIISVFLAVSMPVFTILHARSSLENVSNSSATYKCIHDELASSITIDATGAITSTDAQLSPNCNSAINNVRANVGSDLNDATSLAGMGDPTDQYGQIAAALRFFRSACEHDATKACEYFANVCNSIPASKCDITGYGDYRDSLDLNYYMVMASGTNTASSMLTASALGYSNNQTNLQTFINGKCTSADPSIACDALNNSCTAGNATACTYIVNTECAVNGKCTRMNSYLGLVTSDPNVGRPLVANIALATYGTGLDPTAKVAGAVKSTCGTATNTSCYVLKSKCDTSNTDACTGIVANCATNNGGGTSCNDMTAYLWSDSNGNATAPESLVRDQVATSTYYDNNATVRSITETQCNNAGSNTDKTACSALQKRCYADSELACTYFANKCANDLCNTTSVINDFDYFAKLAKSFKDTYHWLVNKAAAIYLANINNSSHPLVSYINTTCPSTTCSTDNVACAIKLNGGGCGLGAINLCNGGDVTACQIAYNNHFNRTCAEIKATYNAASQTPADTLTNQRLTLKYSAPPSTSPAISGWTQAAWSGTAGLDYITCAGMTTANPASTTGLASWTFSYTGDQQTFTVPLTATYKIEAWGAQGGTAGSYAGGYGGYAYGDINLNSSTSLYIFIGGTGAVNASGFNGGGAPGPSCGPAGGSGASDVRVSINALGNRVIVAGGGGGSGGSGALGGSGGGYTGNTGGRYPDSGAGYGGEGGTQSSGGAGGYMGTCGNPMNGYPGSFGVGGGGSTGNYDGGGGGGGWYGGGGGGNCYGGGGGGGSSYTGGMSANTGTSNGIQSGNGQIKMWLK